MLRLMLFSICLIILHNSEVYAQNSALWKSVEPFYNITEQFLDTIQPLSKSIPAADFYKLIQNASILTADWRLSTSKYAGSYLGFVILFIVGILFIILMPIVGCCICCCRCCCRKCGGRGRPTEKKKAACRKVTYGVLLIITTTIMLCGIVLAFISNQLLHNSLDSESDNFIIKNMINGLSDSVIELNKLPKAAKAASSVEIGKAVERFPPIIQTSLQDLLDYLSRTTSILITIESAKNSVVHINNTRNANSRLVSSAKPYNESNTQLATSLSKVKTNLSDVSDSNCPSGAQVSHCKEIKDYLQVLEVKERMNQTRFVIYNNLNTTLYGLDIEKIFGDLKAGEVKYKNITVRAYEHVRPTVEETMKELNDSKQLDSIWESVDNILHELNSTVITIRQVINKTFTDPITQKQETVSTLVTKFDKYRLYAFMGVGSIALLIILLYYLGLCFGFCGEMPYEDARCCNTGVAANLFLSAIGFAFLFTWILMLLTTILFMMGGLFETEGCRLLTGRAGTAGFERLDLMARTLLGQNINNSMINNAKIAQGILGTCSEDGKSLADALNVQDWIKTSDFQKRVDKLLNDSGSKMLEEKEYITGINIITPEMNDSLLKVEDIIGKLNDVIATIDVDVAAVSQPAIDGQINIVLGAISLISRHASEASVKARFSAQYDDLSSRNNDTNLKLAFMKQQLDSMKVSIQSLNNTGFGIREKIIEAGKRIKDNHNLESATAAFKSAMNTKLTTLMTTTIDSLLKAAGSCKDFYFTVKAVIDGPCRTFLKPFNGFWAGLGLFLLLVIPSIIFSFKLANLYRKTLKYQKDYTEPDYMAYQGFYPSDTIPLDGHGKPKRVRSAIGKERITLRESSHSGQRLSNPAVRQSQRYSQLPPYTPDSYD